MPSDESGLFKEIVFWILGGVATIGAGVANFLNGKVDNKISKDAFAEFKHGNAMSHDRTYRQLKDIQDTQDKIFEKLDGKQDKKRGD